jgi:hypothetical protein
MRILFIYLAVLGFELRVWISCLLSRHSTTWAMLPSLLWFPITSQIRSHLFAQGWPRTAILPVASITGTHHHTWLIGWDGVLLTSILLISASWVTGVIEVIHYPWLLNAYFIWIFYNIHNMYITYTILWIKWFCYT